MNGRHARAALYALLSFVVFAPLFVRYYWPAGEGLDVTGQQIGRDFLNAWAGVRLAFDGHIATLFDIQGYTAAIGAQFGHDVPFHNWSYPPTALLIFWPFAQFPYFAGLALWTVATFALFAAAAVAPVERERWLVVLLLLAAPASLINIVGGQNGFFTGALLVGGILLLDRWPIFAGILFGLLSFKPQLGFALAVALFALGAWRVVGSAIITAAALAAVTLVHWGIEPWRLYLTVTGAYNTLVLAEFHGFYTSMVTTVFGAARVAGLSYEDALWLQLAVAGPALALTAVAVRRTDDPCRRVLVIAAATPLVSPYVMNYDLTALAAPVAWAFAGRLSSEPKWRPIWLLAWMTPVVVMYLNILGYGLAPVALAAVFAMAVRDAMGARSAPWASNQIDRHDQVLAAPEGPPI